MEVIPSRIRIVRESHAWPYVFLRVYSLQTQLRVALSTVKWHLASSRLYQKLNSGSALKYIPVYISNIHRPSLALSVHSSDTEGDDTNAHMHVHAHEQSKSPPSFSLPRYSPFSSANEPSLPFSLLQIDHHESGFRVRLLRCSHVLVTAEHTLVAWGRLEWLHIHLLALSQTLTRHYT